jgi:MFS family permease
MPEPDDSNSNLSATMNSGLRTNLSPDKAWKKNTAIFLSSQALSLLGSALIQYALLWQITLETKSGLMMTLYIICGFLPTFFLSPFAGVWADRYDRKNSLS